MANVGGMTLPMRIDLYILGGIDMVGIKRRAAC